MCSMKLFKEFPEKEIEFFLRNVLHHMEHNKQRFYQLDIFLVSNLQLLLDHIWYIWTKVLLKIVRPL